MSEVGAAYDASGAAWQAGAERVYQRLAEALLDHAGDLQGLDVLDVGAGTAVASRLALGRGAARAVATDLAGGMLRHRGDGVLAVVGDAQRLPFVDGSFDLVVAAFSLGHLPEPVRALTEARRVAPGLVASAFDPSWAHPAKAAVDEAMAAFGFTTPRWYADLKAHESLVEDATSLAGLARSAGYVSIAVDRVDVQTGVATASEMVEWRWGMAHLAPFVVTLPADVRDRAWAASEAAVAGLPPVVVPMLALSAS